jgi:hypothetical protein
VEFVAYLRQLVPQLVASFARACQGGMGPREARWYRPLARAWDWAQAMGLGGGFPNLSSSSAWDHKLVHKLGLREYFVSIFFHLQAKMES